ncbi:protein of unknown function [Hyphomicrobium sp. 1Nfss2.1]
MRVRGRFCGLRRCRTFDQSKLLKKRQMCPMARVLAVDSYIFVSLERFAVADHISLRDLATFGRTKGS